VFSFSTPYLLNAPYANLHSKVGFIFGSMAVLSLAFAYFCVPEMKGRSLEEINQMFQDGVPIRKFGSYDASAALAAAAESGEKLEGATLGSKLTKLEEGRGGEEHMVEQTDVDVHEKL
jgi:hypothetical protein